MLEKTAHKQVYFRPKPPLAALAVVFLITLFYGCPARSAKAESLVQKGAVLEKLCDGFQWAEGPVYHPDGYLLFSDMPKNAIMKYGSGKLSVYLSGMEMPNGLALDAQGRLCVCEHHGRRVIRLEKDGAITVLADRYLGKRLNAPNDLVIRSDGGIYFTDHSFSHPEKTEIKELDFNGVYFLSSSGTLRLVSNDFARPNGLALSPDEKRLYVNDTERGHIRVFNLGQGGMESGGSVFASMSGERGIADGMKTDKEGNVFSTGPGGIWVLSPSGTLIQKINLPEQASNLAWGDDGKSLYITCGGSLYRLKMKTGKQIK